MIYTWIMKRLAGSLGPYLLAGAAAVTGALLAAVGVQQLRLQGVRVELAQAELQHAEEAEAAALQATQDVQRAREAEHRSYQDMAAIRAALQEKEDAEAVSLRTIAELRAGTVRLRQRFVLATACDQRLPGTVSAAPGGDDAGVGGLRNEDAGFLVREAVRADTVARKLAAAQAVITSYLLTCNGDAQ